MNDWNIQARARSCQTCGRAFADGEAYHTLLFEVRGGLERLDACGKCWEDQHRHGAADRKGFLSHWQGLFAAPPPPAPDPIQRDSAESLLRRLTELNSAEWQPAAFILAVMLERKRLLKNREQLRQDGRRIFVYELPRTGEIFTVPDPDLHLDQLAQVQRDVAQLLERGLPGDAPAHPLPIPSADPPPPAADPETSNPPLATDVAADGSAGPAGSPAAEPGIPASSSA